MADLKRVFEKQGGGDLLRRWLRAGVLPFAAATGLLLGFSNKSLEILRLAVSNKILRKLRKKYRASISDFQAKAKPETHKRSNKVWVCWFQGMDSAPALVQQCYRSLQENLTDREIILVTEENYRDFVTFPEHIQKKIESGTISKTHMSDLLRLELLIRYGGTWIDATVFCSGKNISAYMLDSDLFLFQNLKPGLDGHCTCISSWFITACTNHPILLLTRHLLYLYWRRHKTMVDYFLLHDFFQLAIEAYPEQWKKVVPFSNSIPHILLLRLFTPYEEDTWNAVREMTPFHKLTYKFERHDAILEGTYYSVLFAPATKETEYGT